MDLPKPSKDTQVAADSNQDNRKKMSARARLSPDTGKIEILILKDKEKEMKKEKVKERILRVDQFYSRKDRQTHYAKTAKGDAKIREKFEKHNLVIRRKINERGLHEGTEIDIKCSKLAQVLKDIFRDTEKLRLGDSVQCPVISPEALFLAWDQLEDRLDEERRSRQPPDAQLVDSLIDVLTYLETDHGAKRNELKRLVNDGLITHELLGHFFKPNSMLYTNKNELNEGQIMKFVTGEYVKYPDGSEGFVAFASLITHDGENFGWARHGINLPLFKGNMKITDLALFPFDMLGEQQESIIMELTERGRRFDLLRKSPVCKWYGSTALYSEFNGKEWEEIKFLASKRVMINPSSWTIHNSSVNTLRYPTVDCKGSTFDLVKDEDLLFCNHRILGFCFESKRWGAFAVSRLTDPMWDKTAFKKVMLPPGQLDLIKDLVVSHQRQSDTVDKSIEENEEVDDDIIKGKGKGLVGLLSGNPGVGKTLTAEAVAEVTCRPLYTVAAGELGTKIEAIDQKLGLVFDITRRWCCVLLIDEADVFLHKRDETNLQRNAIVSVFLRRLEYFQGVAILTTNRKLDIDIAFMSRIHFKFHLDDLGWDTMMKIWQNFLPKERFGHIKKADLKQLAKDYSLSGREIKNVAYCAKCISRTRKEALTIKLVRETIHNLGFLHETGQRDLSQVARQPCKRAADHDINRETEPLNTFTLPAGDSKKRKTNKK